MPGSSLKFLFLLSESAATTQEAHAHTGWGHQRRPQSVFLRVHILTPLVCCTSTTSLAVLLHVSHALHPQVLQSAPSPRPRHSKPATPLKALV